LVARENTGVRKALVADGVADIVAEPCVLATPVNGLLCLPSVGATASETEWLEVHGLEGDVSGKKQEIGPRDLLAVLLLDGPEEAAGLVEASVVGPAVERGKSLLAL
jgi:hypothetical protein